MRKTIIILALAVTLFFVMPTVFSAEYLKGISSSDLNQYFDFDGYVRQIPISASSGNDLAWTWTNELDWNQRANYDTKYVWNKVNVTYLPNICDAGSPCDGDGKIGRGSGGKGDDGYVFPSSVDYFDSNYVMYYQGYDGGNYDLFMATSLDALVWTKVNNDAPGQCDSGSPCDYGRVGRGTNGHGDYPRAQNPYVIYDTTDATYKMWYTGRIDSSNMRIFMATSPDGFTWTKVDNSTPADSDTTSTNGRIPQGTTGTGDDVRVIEPFVMYDEGIYKMWYAGYDGSKTAIYYATSSDGLTWTKYDNTTASECDAVCEGNGKIGWGSIGTADASGANAPTVIKTNNGYVMIYEGDDASSTAQILIATSPDGLTWTKIDNTIPSDSSTISYRGIIPQGPTVDNIDDYRVYGGDGIIIGNEYWYYYTGNNSAASSIGGHLATTTNLVTSAWDSNLIAYYNFNDTNGTHIYDLVQSFDGVLTNGATISSYGMWDTNALSLDGTNDYVTVGDVGNVNTIIAWVKSDEATAELIDLNGSTNISIASNLLTSSNLTSPTYYVNGVGGATSVLSSDWTHIAITIAIPVDAFSLNIGKISSAYYDGLIDEVKIYDKVLTQEEVLEDYNSFLEAKFTSSPDSIIDGSTERNWSSIRVNEDLGFNFNSQLGGEGKELDSTNDLFDSDLIGLWHLNDDATDSSGNSNDGSWGGSEAYSTGLFNSNAANFDGSTDYIDIGSGIAPSGRAVSLSFWMKPGETFDSSVGRQDIIGDVSDYWFMYDWQDGKLSWTIGDGTTHTDYTTTFGNGKWYHIVGTLASDNSTKIYIDGVEVVSGSQAQAFGGTNNFYIGRNSNYFKGDLEEVAVWDRTLTPTEVAELYNLQASRFYEPSMVGLWHLNGDTTDSSGNNHTGIENNFDGDENIVGLWYTNAYDFDGTNDYIEVTDHTDFTFSDGANDSPFTLSSWVNLNDATSNVIMSKDDRTTGVEQREWFFYINGTDHLALALWDETNNVYIETVADFVLTSYEGEWIHILATYNGNKNPSGIDLYLNGSLIPSTDNDDVAYANMINTNASVLIGAYEDTTGSRTNAFIFDGKGEEYVIWNKKLSSEEVRDLYRKGVSRLDLNVYSCSDANCVTKTSEQYITDINNNETTSFSLSSSVYFGYEAYFKPNYTDFSDYNAGFFHVGALLEDISVNATAGNQAPTISMQTIDGTSSSAQFGTYSSATNGDLNIGFTISDPDDDRLTLNIYLADNNTVQDTSGTNVIVDLNLDSTYCESESWTSEVTCYVDINSQLSADGNKYVKVAIDDGSSSPVYSFSNRLTLDNTAPVVTPTYSSTWVRSNSFSLSCSDAISDCNSVRYKINTGDWQIYSASVSVVGDGNYLITYDANDDLNNFLTPTKFNLLVGVNGELKTYSDQNKPRSFFGGGQTVQLLFDVNLAIAPTITISDSNNTTLISEATMQNYSNEATFGISDYNTYYYSFDLNGENGWYKVVIQNQVFNDIFYQGQTWLDQYTDSESNVFSFTHDLNVQEPNTLQRWFYPVDTNLNFSYNADINSVRVLDYNGTNYVEIPSQLHNANYSGSQVTDANIVFLSSIDKNELRQYKVSYSLLNYDYNYSGDLNLIQNGFLYDLNTNNYSFVIDINQGGVIKDLQSNIGTGVDLNGSTIISSAPRVDSSGTYQASGDTSPVFYQTINGPLMKKISVKGDMDIGYTEVYDYNLDYTFYANSRYFLLDINVFAKSSSIWENYFDMYDYFNNSEVNKLATSNGSISTIDVNGENNSITLSDKNFFLLYNKNSLNSIGTIFISKVSNKTMNDTMTELDISNYITLRRNLSGLTSVASGDYFVTKQAKVISNPLRTTNDINSIFYSLQNPLIVSVGSTTTNDSTAPILLDINYSPQDMNDQADLNCYSSWSDSTSVIDRVVLNVSGSNLDVNYSEIFRDANAFMSQIIDANSINAGDINCIFTAYDLANNSDTNTITISVSDSSPPSIVAVSNSPDSNSLLDPSTIVTIDANINEYTGMNTAILYTRGRDENNSWTDWNAITMLNDQNFSDTNYHYATSFTTARDDNSYQYYVYALGVDGLDVNSSIYTIYSYSDWTWSISPSTFGTKSGALDSILTVGDINVTNTGDKNLSFRVKSNWDDKYKIWYDSEPETAAGYTFSLAIGKSEILTTSLRTKASERSDELTITVDATNSSASPDTNTSTATIISLSDGPFMYTEWVTTDSSVTQGDTNVNFSARVTNLGNSDANAVVLDWNFPNDWTITSGTETTNLTTLAVSDSVSSSIIFSINSSAEAGDKNIVFTAQCCNISSKSRLVSNITTVNSSGSGDDGVDDDDDAPPSGGPGGNPGGTGTTGGTGVFSDEQKDVFFQTTQFFELVRGQDSGFPILIENPLDGTLQEIHLEVSGLASKYLQLKDKYIAFLDRNESFKTEIEILSPKYFSPGKYEITFIISGIFVDDKNKTVSFGETRLITLLIHDTNENQAVLFIDEMQEFFDKMVSNSFKTNNLYELIADANALVNAREFDEAKIIYLQAKELFEMSFEARAKITNLEKIIFNTNRQGISTLNTNRLLQLAQLSFQRGDYALSLDRLKEAELTFSLETKGEFNILIFLMGNIDRVILMIALLIIAAYLFYLGIKLFIFGRKLKEFNSEAELLLILIQGIQKKCFVENRMSIGEYYDALQQYENRMAFISERIITYESKRNNVLKISSSIKRLRQEKSKLISLLKKTQEQYFELGLIETSIYETKVKSLTKRLSEVEEAIVTKEFMRTTRKTRGFKRFFWKVFYKIFK